MTRLLWIMSLILLCLWSGIGVEANPTSAITDWSSLEKLQNVLKSATLLPIQSQKHILKTIGAALVSLGEGSQCNVFGGPDACVPVPADSDYAKLCKEASTNVDCAFQLEALEGISKDPESVMKDKLFNDGYGSCNQCFTALHKVWCAQTVPTCGTFDKVVDEILPMIAQVALKKTTAIVAVQQAVPRMLQAASLGLPCRKMCDAITTTCGCGQPTTFGEVMSALHKKPRPGGFNTNMSATTSREVFHNIWDKQVCELFAEDSTPGFAGVCEVPEKEERCGWCNQAQKHHPKISVHEQIVAQLAQTISGMMQGGLQKIITEAGGIKSKGAIGDWNWTQDESSERKSHPKNHSGAVIVLLLLVALAAGAFVMALRAHRVRQNPSQYVDLNSMGYTPPIL